MAKIVIGGVEYPLVMTVGVLDEMALKGYNADRVPQYFLGEGQSFETKMDHGIDFLQLLMNAGQRAAEIRDGATPLEIPPAETLRVLLTPGQVWGLCDAAIMDSIRRTVEAEPGKNGDHAATASP